MTGVREDRRAGETEEQGVRRGRDRGVRGDMGVRVDRGIRGDWGVRGDSGVTGVRAAAAGRALDGHARPRLVPVQRDHGGQGVGGRRAQPR